MTSGLEKIQPQKPRPPLKNFNDGNSARSRAATGTVINPLNQNLSEVAARQCRQPSPTAKRPALRTEELRFRRKRGADEEPENATSELWKLHRVIQELLRPPVTEDGTRKRGPSVCGCGYASLENENVTVHLRRTGSRPKAAISGIFRCGSPWLCPICSKKAAVERQARVQKVVEATLKRGGLFGHVVVTVRHERGQSLAELKTAVSEASRVARSGRAWKDVQASSHVVGALSAPEVTYSTRNGWHFHVHQGFPMLTSNVGQATEVCNQFVERYLQELKKRGFDADWNGQHVSISNDPLGAAAYIGKGLSWEIAGGSNSKKKPRLTGSLTPFDIARRAAGGNEVMRALWLEYAAVMPGTRSCVITAAIAKHLDIQADDAAPSEDETCSEQTEPVDVVGTIPTMNWNALLRLGHVPQFVQKLETLEASYWPSIRAWAIEVSTSPLKAKDIPCYPCDLKPSDVPFAPKLSRSELVRTIAWRGLEYMSGRRLIENEVGQLKVDWQKFGGTEPPDAAEVVGCIAQMSHESLPVQPISRALENRAICENLLSEDRKERTAHRQ